MADTAPDDAQLPARVLPHAERMTLDGLTHEGPEDDGKPLVVARVLRDFCTAA
ncbi:hypothetical protein [Dactylosporangium sp. CA-139066]|uniref:hypothetical protein n=1 Tax=Dactylosporangium sp. CA-139066 TaxID=3239930 RepID=UPI003D93ED42